MFDKDVVLPKRILFLMLVACCIWGTQTFLRVHEAQVFATYAPRQNTIIDVVKTPASDL